MGGTDRSAALAAVATGLLVVASFPALPGGVGVAELAWVALVPAVLALRGASLRRAAAIGAGVGLIVGAAGFAWLGEVVDGMFDVGAAGRASVVLLHALAYAPLWVVWALLTAALTARRVPEAAAVAAALVLAEGFVPRAFPASLAHTQYLRPGVLQAADLVGLAGVAGVIGVVNAGVAAALRPLDTPGILRGRRPAWIAAGLVGALLAYGAVRSAQLDRAPRSAHVGVVQPGGAGMEDPAGHLLTLQAGSAALAERGVELIAWPEGSYPVDAFPRDIGRFVPAPGPLPDAPEADDEAGVPVPVRRSPQRGFRAAVVFGSPTADAGGRRNTAWVLGADGTVHLRYDKVHLMPVGERPIAPALLRPLLGPDYGRSAWVAGDRLGLVELPRPAGALRVGVLICYEAILGAFVEELGRHRPDVVVNVSSDRWLPSPAARELHLALVAARAVELRAPILRANIDGTSAIVDAAGRFVAVERGRGAATLHAEVAPRTLRSPARSTAAPARLLLLVLVIGALARRPGPPAARSR